MRLCGANKWDRVKPLQPQLKKEREGDDDDDDTTSVRLAWMEKGTRPIFDRCLNQEMLRLVVMRMTTTTMVVAVAVIVMRGCCSSGSRGDICEMRPFLVPVHHRRSTHYIPAWLRSFCIYLPGGRTAATHDNALNCVQSDQQMTTTRGFLSSRCCSCR